MRFLTIISWALFALIMTGCNSSKEVSKPAPTPHQSDIPGKVMVLLDRSVKPTKLEKDLYAYSLKSQGQTSRTEYRFLFSYDVSKVSKEKIIEKINALSYASEATIPQQVNR